MTLSNALDKLIKTPRVSLLYSKDQEFTNQLHNSMFNQVLVLDKKNAWNKAFIICSRIIKKQRKIDIGQ